jgi:hypothetical protein
LPHHAPVDFFFFPKVKRELVGLTLTQNTFKKEWEGDLRTLSEADFATAFRQWYECCKKCVDIAMSTLKKAKNKHIATYNCFFVEVFQKLCEQPPYMWF